MHKFNLIENANDSLEHALEHIGPVYQNNAGDWKRIIVDLAHVIELLFKEKLRQIHPAFIFTNIDKYPSHNAHAVGAELAFKRLRNVGGIQFSEIEINAICTAREKRNEIEHYEFSISSHEARALVGQVLSFIFNFADEQLKLDWKELHLKKGKWWVLSQYTEFYEELLLSAKKKINDEGLHVLSCSSCHNETFDIDSEKCLTCTYEEEVLSCKKCSSPYIFSSCEFSEEVEICPGCEGKDNYAAANFEKY